MSKQIKIDIDSNKNPILHIAGLAFDNFIATDAYKKAVELSPVYHKPNFKFKDIEKIFPNISYRMINDWDSKGLLVNHRENAEKGWRRFSFAGCIRLKIIQDLKSYGMSNDSILNCINDIFEPDKEHKMYFFEFFYFVASLKKRSVIVVTKDGHAAFFMEKDYYLASHNGYSCAEPLLILPFVQYVAQLTGNQLEAEQLFTTLDVVDEKQKRQITAVVNKIADTNYTDYSIERKNRHDNDYLVMKSKKVATKQKLTGDDLLKKVKNKPFTKTTAVTDENGSLTIITEETDKLE